MEATLPPPEEELPLDPVEDPPPPMTTLALERPPELPLPPRTTLEEEEPDPPEEEPLPPSTRPDEDTLATDRVLAFDDDVEDELGEFVDRHCEEPQPAGPWQF